MNICIVPANGLKPHNSDFTMRRFTKYLESQGHKISCITGKKDDIVDFLMETPFDSIVYRGWMEAYPFGAYLCKQFKNVTVVLKDWNYSTEEEYRHMFGEPAGDDFKAIETIFKNAKNVFTHYGEDEFPEWISENNLPRNPFVFFPDFCDPDRFSSKDHTPVSEGIKLVWAGSFFPTSGPRGFSNHRMMFDSSMYLTERGIDISFVVPPANYNNMMAPSFKWAYKDCLYENRFNDYYHIVKGSETEVGILQPYHFGIFMLDDHHKHQRFVRNAFFSKLAMYLEEGIPLAVNSSMKALSEMVRKHDIGIVFDNSQCLNAQLKLMNQTRFDKLFENVKKFRWDFTYEEFQPDKYL